MSYKNVKNFRAKQKERIIYVMGGKCAICGYNKCAAALELHHLDPSEKEFTFSQNTNRKWETIALELPKTIMVCANCHREVHSDLIDNDSLVSSFDSAKEQEVREEIESHKTKTEKLCKYCGKPIDSQATLCVACNGKIHRKVERPTREQLKEDLRSMSMLKVGQKYGVTDNSIRKWCDSMNLPRKVSEIKQYSDEEWELI